MVEDIVRLLEATVLYNGTCLYNAHVGYFSKISDGLPPIRYLLECSEGMGGTGLWHNMAPLSLTEHPTFRLPKVWGRKAGADRAAFDVPPSLQHLSPRPRITTKLIYHPNLR